MHDGRLFCTTGLYRRPLKRTSTRTVRSWPQEAISVMGCRSDAACLLKAGVTDIPRNSLIRLYSQRRCGRGPSCARNERLSNKGYWESFHCILGSAILNHAFCRYTIHTESCVGRFSALRTSTTTCIPPWPPWFTLPRNRLQAP
jgi:hypothetical protein